MWFYEMGIAYDGTNFFGSSKQDKYRTVEGELLRSLKKIFYDEDLTLVFAGRTDKSVHAINQIVSFNLEHKMKYSSKEFLRIINKILPKDIKVNYIKTHKKFFNARFSVKSRVYKYVMELYPHNLFSRNYVLPYDKNLNLSKIKKAKKIFLGTHDFLSYSTSEKTNTIRTIKKFSIKKDGNLLIFIVEANGFLRSQIRMMIGALLNYNEDKLSLFRLQDLLKNPKKGAANFKVSGSGLYFLTAKY